MGNGSQARMERSQRGASGLVVTLAPGCAFPRSVLGRRRSRCSLATKSLSPKELSMLSLREVTWELGQDLGGTLRNTEGDGIVDQKRRWSEAL